jgi:ATP-dependent DNA helicase RecG
MAKKENKFNPRVYMELAIDEMNKSIHEPRKDKSNPNVGAVLIKPDGTVETAHRGKLRYGDHAEFTLLERMNRSNILDGSVLFTTLEPCAPGARSHPKLSCAERIVNARIEKVWIGIEDPDPKVDRKGIKHLENHGIKCEMFDPDLQKIIMEQNEAYIKEAKERAKKADEEKEEVILSEKETVESRANLQDLSQVHIEKFFEKAGIKTKYDSKEAHRILVQLGILKEKDNAFIPTGLGLLIFGTNPQLVYPNAMVRAVFKTKGRGEEPENFAGPIVSQSGAAMNWFEEKIGFQINREKAERKKIYDYPAGAIRETLTNAIVHRDYDIEGAPVYFEINDKAIIIKSPGQPVHPIKFEQIERLNAPSLSRNPKIMYIFDQLELVEQRGLGFQTIKELPDKYGLPLPLVEFEDPYIVFTFPRSMSVIKDLSNKEGISELTEEELKGYQWVKLNGIVTTSDYAEHFEFNMKKAQRHLFKFKELGLVILEGRGPSAKYFIPDDNE